MPTSSRSPCGVMSPSCGFIAQSADPIPLKHQHNIYNRDLRAWSQDPSSNSAQTSASPSVQWGWSESLPPQNTGHTCQGLSRVPGPEGASEGWQLWVSLPPPMRNMLFLTHLPLFTKIKQGWHLWSVTVNPDLHPRPTPSIHVVTEHLKCGRCEWRCTWRCKYTLYFEDLMWKEKKKKKKRV